jgi:DNA-binding transcriptional LysR family regulator
MKELSGHFAGPLLIGASTTIADFLLPPILGAFKVRYPAVVTRLFVANSEYDCSAESAHALSFDLIALARDECRFV